MQVLEIRRLNLRYLAESKYGRATLAEKLGYPDCNYLNQLLTGHSVVGEKTARKIEERLGLLPGWMDAPYLPGWPDGDMDRWWKDVCGASPFPLSHGSESSHST